MNASITKAAVRKRIKSAAALRCLAHGFHQHVVGKTLPIAVNGSTRLVTLLDGKRWEIHLTDIHPITEDTFQTYTTVNACLGRPERKLCGTFQILAEAP